MVRSSPSRRRSFWPDRDTPVRSNVEDTGSSWPSEAVSIFFIAELIPRKRVGASDIGSDLAPPVDLRPQVEDLHSASPRGVNRPIAYRYICAYAAAIV